MVSELMSETPTRLDMMCEAAVELGKELVPDEARLRADYDLTLREITWRLKDAGKKNNDYHLRMPFLTFLGVHGSPSFLL